MARLFVLIALVAITNAAFPLSSIRQSIESGGAGVFDECPVVSPDAPDDFKCYDCLGESCPDYCCFHEFEGSVGSTGLLCEIDGCCVRVVNDKVGHQMFVKEGLTATSRHEDGSPFCGEMKVNTQCPSCAYAFLNGKALKCSNGFHAPARNEPNVGEILCSAVPKTESSDIAEKKEDTGVSQDGPSEGAEEEKTTDGEFPSAVPKKEEKTKAQEPPREKSKEDRKPAAEDTSAEVSGTEPPLKEKNDETREEEDEEERKDDDEVNSSTEKANSAQSSTSKGLIAGATLGSIALLTGLFLIAMLCFRKRQRERVPSIPFEQSQIAQGTQPPGLHGKGIAQVPHSKRMLHKEHDVSVDSLNSPPVSNETWPESPPRVATKRRRQIISPLAPLQRPMPTTPPESEAGESISQSEAEQVDRDMGRTPNERRSDSETESVDRDPSRAAPASADRGLAIGQSPLSTPLSSLIPPIIPVPDQDTDQGPGSVPR